MTYSGPSRSDSLDAEEGVLELPGARLAFEVAGTGPAVVLIHGFGLDLRMWEPQFELLSASFRVVRYDCRGFGDRGRLNPAVPYTHEDDLFALLDHLGIVEAALVGLSFGGQVALRAALVAPARVYGLVLLDSLLDGVPWDPDARAAMAEVDRQVQAGGVEAGRAAWLAHPFFAPARQRPDLAALLAEMVDAYPGQHWLGQDPHRASSRPPVDACGEVSVPTLVIAGARDVPCFLAMAEVLAARIPGARYVQVADSGHMVNMEQPEVTTDLLVQFLGGISRQRRRSP